MYTKPPGVEYEIILCCQCLSEGRAQRTWLEQQTMNLICTRHGAIYAIQAIG